MDSRHSAFKQLLINFLACGGDTLKLDKKFRKTIRVCVKEVHPQFVLTDGQFNLSGYITKEAFTEYTKNPANEVRISDLRDYMLNLERWTIDLVQVSAADSFTSYAGLEMRLIVSKFSVFSDSRVVLPNKYTTNLFRDDVVTRCIANFIDSQQKVFLEKAAKKVAKPVALSKLLPKDADSQMIKVKTEVGSVKPGAENSLSIDGAPAARPFTGY